MLNIRKFLSVSVQLSQQSCNLIRKALLANNTEKYIKGPQDFVTETDYKVQTLLFKGLKHYFPELRLIGEQTKESDIDFDPQSIKENFIPQEICFKSQLPLNKTCVWIDPIDSTASFIGERKEDVSVLIGLSYENKAYAGIIGTPYFNLKGERVFDPTITFGTVEESAYEFQCKNNQFHQLKPRVHQNIRVAVSYSRRNESKQLDFLQKLKAQKIVSGGIGRKGMMVAKGETEFMIHLADSIYKWDTCAPEAIVRAIGGVAVGKDGKTINYTPDTDKQNVKQGAVFAGNHLLYEQAVNSGTFQK